MRAVVRSPWLILILGVLIGTFAGRLIAHGVGSRFVDPYALDESRWRVITPALGLSLGPAGPGRVTHVSEGALNITEHVFFRPDTVVAQADAPVHGVDVVLAPDSAILRVRVGAPPGVFVLLSPSGFAASGMADQWQAVDAGGRYQLRTEEGWLTLRAGGETKRLAPIRPDGLELSTEQGQARVRQIRLLGMDDEPLMEERFDRYGTPQNALTGGMVLGGVLGGLLSVILMWGAGPWSALLLLLPVAVGFVPAPKWLVVAERLYLTETSGADLALAVLALSLLPLLGVVVIQGIRRIGEHPDAPEQLKWIWWGLAIVVCALGWSNEGPLIGGIAAIFVLGWGARAWRLGWGAWWGLDLISLGVLTFCSVSAGLLCAALWRVLVSIGTAGAWSRRAPRVGVDLLLLSVLMLLPGAEFAVRSTVLGTAWNAERLSMERPNERGWKTPTAGWAGRCGPSDAERTLSVVVAGGSSTGGAYQFGEDQSAFFPAIAHQSLCAALPKDTALHTRNYGGGDRNTFTIRHSLDAMLADAQPDLVVLYVGVNDLLTQHHTLTRKQRTEIKETRGEALGFLGQLSTQLRLITAMDLLLRAVPDPSSPTVADVPLSDARENHDAIQGVLEERGSTLQLLTEHVWLARQKDLAEYRAMQREFAADHSHIEWFDASAVFAGMATEEVLLDVNHLSRAGNQRLGEALAVTWKSLLGLTAESPSQGDSDPL